MNEYLNNWFTVIEQMQNDNTYKLAWGRAIIECIYFDKITEENNKIIIEFDDISRCMIKYYWNQLFFFNLKQSPNDKKPPKICTETNKLIDEYKNIKKSNIPVWHDEGIKTIIASNKEIYQDAVRRVSKTLHENVCWRFKKVNGDEIALYEYDKKLGSRIYFQKDKIEWLKEYGFANY